MSSQEVVFRGEMGYSYLQQLHQCPKCKGTNFNLYKDNWFCFDCKTKILNIDYVAPNDKKELALTNLKKSLDACGKWAKHSVYCNSCEADKHDDSLLYVERKIHTCLIRLCDKPYCLSTRYAETLKSFEDVKRFKDINKLLHFAIGFEKIHKDEFENNFDYHKKRFERVMNTYVKLLRKGNKLKKGFRAKPNEVYFDPINLKGFRVLDISKGENKGKWDNHYYIHFHFATIPFKKGGKEFSVMEKVRQKLLGRQRKKIPFHLQIFKKEDSYYTDKDSLLKYISLRAIGLYKKYETNKEFKPEKNFDIIKDIKKGKWLTLKDLVTPEQYIDNFYKKRHVATIGNHYFCFNCKKEIPLKTYNKDEEKVCPCCNSKEVKLAFPKSLRGTNRADNMVLVTCKRHGKININDFFALRHEFEFNIRDPPPDFDIKNAKKSILTLVNAMKLERFEDDELVKEVKNTKIKDERKCNYPKNEDWGIESQKVSKVKSPQKIHDKNHVKSIGLMIRELSRKTKPINEFVK